MILSILFLIIGLVILVFGAEILVRGSSSISKKLGIPPLVIGLTIVAFGTSAPEFVVNVFSAVKGTTDLALGNILGSNISNIFLILGISALIIDLKVKKTTTWKEIPFAILAVFVVYAMANDQILDGASKDIISRVDGIILLGFFSIFMFYAFELFRKKSVFEAEMEVEIKDYSNTHAILMSIGGIICLFLGGQLLVNNAVILAKLAGMSEMLIGLTVVAIGTSLPELATSVVAALKKENDIAIGNIVGSNIFNIFWILGVSSIIKPIPISFGANFDIEICLIATVVLFLSMFIDKKHELQRWQGILFVILYVSYITFLIFRG